MLVNGTKDKGGIVFSFVNNSFVPPLGLIYINIEIGIKSKGDTNYILSPISQPPKNYFGLL